MRDRMNDMVALGILNSIFLVIYILSMSCLFWKIGMKQLDHFSKVIILMFGIAIFLKATVWLIEVIFWYDIDDGDDKSKNNVIQQLPWDIEIYLSGMFQIIISIFVFKMMQVHNMYTSSDAQNYYDKQKKLTIYLTINLMKFLPDAYILRKFLSLFIFFKKLRYEKLEQQDRTYLTIIYIGICMETVILFTRNIATPIVCFHAQISGDDSIEDGLFKSKIYLYDISDFLISMMVLKLFHYQSKKLMKPVKKRKKYILKRDSQQNIKLIKYKNSNLLDNHSISDQNSINQTIDNFRRNYDTQEVMMLMEQPIYGLGNTHNSKSLISKKSNNTKSSQNERLLGGSIPYNQDSSCKSIFIDSNQAYLNQTNSSNLGSVDKNQIKNSIPSYSNNYQQNIYTNQDGLSYQTISSSSNGMGFKSMATYNQNSAGNGFFLFNKKQKKIKQLKRTYLGEKEDVDQIRDSIPGNSQNESNMQQYTNQNHHYQVYLKNTEISEGGSSSSEDEENQSLNNSSKSKNKPQKMSQFESFLTNLDKAKAKAFKQYIKSIQYKQ
eukprot:403338014